MYESFDTLSDINSENTILNPLFFYGVMQSKIPQNIQRDLEIIKNQDIKDLKSIESESFISYSKESKYYECSNLLPQQLIKYLFDISQKYLHILKINRAKVEKINLKSAFLIKKNENDYIKSNNREGRLTALICLKSPSKEDNPSNGTIDFIYGSSSIKFLNTIGGSKSIDFKDEYIYVYPSWLNTIVYPTFEKNNTTELIEVILT